VYTPAIAGVYTNHPDPERRNHVNNYTVTVTDKQGNVLTLKGIAAHGPIEAASLALDRNWRSPVRSDSGNNLNLSPPLQIRVTH
jgi:hypothetical protein